MLRIDVNVPGQRSDRLSGAGRQSVRRRGPRHAAGDLELRPAESVALQLRRSGARRHRRARHRRRRPERVGRNRLRAGRPRRAQLRLAQPRRGARQRHLAAAGVSAARRSDSRVRPRRRAARSPAASSIAAAALGPAYRGPVLLRRLRPGRVWSLGAHDRSGDRRGACSETSSSTPPSSAAPARSATSARSASTPTASCTSSATRTARSSSAWHTGAARRFRRRRPSRSHDLPALQRRLVHPELGNRLRDQHRAPMGPQRRRAGAGDYDGDGVARPRRLSAVDAALVHRAVDRRLPTR